MATEETKIDHNDNRELETKKFTEWENEPTVMDLKQDYTDAQSDHQAHVSQVRTWLDNLNITGAAKIEAKVGKSAIQPKTIRKQAEWRYSSLTEPFLSTSDVFDASPATFEDKKSALQNGMLLNHQFNTKIDKVRFFDDYIHTAVDEGTVICRVGWDYEEEIIEVEVPQFTYQVVPTQEAMQLHQQLHQQMQADPVQYQLNVPPEMQQAHEMTMQSQQPVMPVPNGVILEEQVNVLKNQPTLTVCDYDRVIVDPSCEGDLDRAGFIIYEFETNKAELEKDGKYSNIDSISLDANSVLSSPDHQTKDDTSFNFSDEPRKKFLAQEYWGYWDVEGDGILVPIVATYVGDVLIRMEENPYPDGKLPFVSAQYLPRRKSIYGEPDGSLLEDNQKIIGAVTRGMIDIMGRSANGQKGMRKDALDLTNKRKYDRGEDYEFNANVQPQQAMIDHVYPEIPQSAQLMLGMQNAEAESLTGVQAFSSGISGQALGDTATGIRSALDATSKRELAILRRLAEGIIKIGRKIVAMNGMFLTENEVIRITNEQFVEIAPEDLEGNIDLKLTVSTPEADDQKAQELAFMLQTTGQTMGPEFSKIILADIARLRKMPELAQRIESYEPKPDPLQQQIQQLEIQKLQAEIAKIQSETAENYAEAQLDGAKAQTEVAKGRNLNSDSDQKDLAFVEQETGTNHAREMDKQGAQARANARLKITEAALDKENTIVGPSDPTVSNGVTQQ